ncbi:MAG: 50S ribosomal protein L31 [Candidatus Kapabacteria bacterium]|nr:50S ribosomal protein L31 [Candidatus Kapabacteria bacterium]MCS7169125.1 50S ribosomal protein L31 [Candidatus Kapabacteria bacterium]MDW7997781.1 50S ribosomal protein L31 [Bacteroidota bacterium]MDW8225333.1 50S ribosomal protein L31 [Bacteroidota bacterium]
MKKGIHPYYRPIEVVMTDGTVFTTRSCAKRDRLVLEIDSKSHPFFTGKQVLVDTTGRVERFQRRLQKTEQIRQQKQTPPRQQTPSGKEE